MPIVGKRLSEVVKAPEPKKKLSKALPKKKPVAKKVAAPIKKTPVKKVPAKKAVGRRTGGRAHNTNNAARADKKAQAFDLKLAGHSLREIGAMLGVSHTCVGLWIREECEERVAPLAAQVRAMELARLDKYLTYLESRMEQGDDKAIGIAVRISESRRKLLGTDAPLQVDATVAEVPPRPGVLQKMAQARANQAAEEAAIRAASAVEVEDTEDEAAEHTSTDEVEAGDGEPDTTAA